MTRVSIVIPTRNAGAGFTRTLQAIAAQQANEPIELVVIDSGSTDGTPTLAERYGARVIGIAPEEFGHGRTRNAAIAACSGEYIVLMVQDAVPVGNAWLTPLVRALDGHRRAAGAVSRCIPREDARYVESFLGERDAQAAGDESIERSWPTPERLVALSVTDLRRLCAFNDVSAILRRTVWERCPLPDVIYGEDIAWGVTVLRAGYTLVYAPASIVRHSHHRSLGYELRRAYVDRRMLQALHASVVPAAEGPRPRSDGPRENVFGLMRTITEAARDEGELTPRVWYEIRARLLAGAIGVGLARYAATGRVPWLQSFDRLLTRGI